MNRIRPAASALALLLLSACAHPDLLEPGMTRAELDARFGKPVAMRHDPDGDVLIYSSAPMGQRASAAHMGADGRIASVEPVLDTGHFATIVVDAWNRNDVLTHFGTPAEVTRIPRYEVWSYRYRENQVWDSLFSVMFDAAGIVRQTQNGPDPMYDKRDSGRD